jgi:hypothetical protein
MHRRRDAPAAVQQTGRCKRLTGIAPRAIWAALWIQSSWGGKPHRCQRSQSPQVKPDVRGRRDLRPIPLGDNRRMISSVRIAVLHGDALETLVEYSARCHQRH